MGSPDRADGWYDGGDEAPATTGSLGPPGWDEFAAARERFMRTLAVAGLESAWAAPAHAAAPEGARGHADASRRPRP